MRLFFLCSSSVSKAHRDEVLVLCNKLSNTIKLVSSELGVEAKGFHSKVKNMRCGKKDPLLIQDEIKNYFICEKKRDILGTCEDSIKYIKANMEFFCQGDIGIEESQDAALCIFAVALCCSEYFDFFKKFQEYLHDRFGLEQLKQHLKNRSSKGFKCMTQITELAAWSKEDWRTTMKMRIDAYLEVIGQMETVSQTTKSLVLSHTIEEEFDDDDDDEGDDFDKALEGAVRRYEEIFSKSE